MFALSAHHHLQHTSSNPNSVHPCREIIHLNSYLTIQCVELLHYAAPPIQYLYPAQRRVRLQRTGIGGGIGYQP